MEEPGRKHDAYAVLKLKDFRLFLSFRFFMTIAAQMQSIIVGWQVYELTHDPLSLGLIGLSEALPFIAVALYAGHIADRFSRKKIILWFDVLFLLASSFLLICTIYHAGIIGRFGVVPIYLGVAVSGIARAFLYPATIALMAQIVPRSLYTNSATWNSTLWHIAAITGPAIGGLVYGFFGVKIAYLTVIVSMLISFVLLSIVRNQPAPARNEKEKLVPRLMTGIQFVFSNQILLGAMTLDMFAVLFGGAVAMLPVFAGEVLKVGPQGLGVLRAAPMVGAVLMSIILAYRPPMVRAGKLLFMGVAGFGLSIICFAISRNFYLSLGLLALSGMFDNISVVIRASTMQLVTPDEMRGRVASVNSIFIGSSNEIGSFESGVAAKLMGLIPSVIFGGLMTLGIVGATAKWAPKLRKLNLKTIK
ncbi:MAG: MFS transporter [Bacteroidetes bacterium]|nr:MFS transporter [Bacteroidota bacterium]